MKPSPPLYFSTQPDTDRAFEMGVPLGSCFHVSYVSMKSADALETGAENEDALAWKVEAGGKVVCFAVCDGVSGSYRGSVAANYLAHALVNTLEDLCLRRALEGLTPDALKQYLNSLTEDASRALAEQQVGVAAYPMFAEVIKHRQRSGSQTVFFCGLLDCRSGAASFFAWLGNVYGQVFAPAEQGLRPFLDQATMLDDRERWTTTRGCLGTPHIERVPTSDIGRVLVFSDGFEEVTGQLEGARSSRQDAELIASLAERTFRDDATLLSFRALSRAEDRP